MDIGSKREAKRTRQVKWESEKQTGEEKSEQARGMEMGMGIG